MKKYKKYKAIYNVAYIAFFSYLLILSVGNFNFGKYVDYIPYLIVIPFLAFCAVSIGIEIIMQKNRRKHASDKSAKGNESQDKYEDTDMPTLSNI